MKRSCGSCGTGYEAVRASSRYCSGTCRKRAQRGHTATAKTPPAALMPSDDGSEVEGVTTVAVRRQLAAVGREETYLGAAALSLAGRIDASTAVMGFAALVKELRATMDAALEGTGRTADALDELRARRDRKRAG